MDRYARSVYVLKTFASGLCRESAGRLISSAARGDRDVVAAEVLVFAVALGELDVDDDVPDEGVLCRVEAI